MVGVGVRLEKVPIDPHGCRRPSQWLHERAVASGGTSQARGALDRMGSIKDHRCTQGPHGHQPREIVDQAAVAKKGASLAEHHISAAAGEQFGHRMPHVLGREKLPLLDVYSFAGGRSSEQEIGLAAEERRDLQKVTHHPGRGGLLRKMNVGGDRHPLLPTDLFQHRQPLVEAEPAVAGGTRAVGLVERRFEDELHSMSGSHRRERLGHSHAQRFTLNSAGARDHQRRLPRPAAGVTNLSRKSWSHSRSFSSQRGGFPFRIGYAARVLHSIVHRKPATVWRGGVSR